MRTQRRTTEVCSDCDQRYNGFVNSDCPYCKRDTWHRIRDGLTLAWQHAQTDTVVAIVEQGGVDHGHMQKPRQATTTKQYQVVVRSDVGEPIVWPDTYPQHGGRGLYQTLEAAKNATALIREHVSKRGTLDGLEVADD